MKRIKVATQYSTEFLEVTRPQPLSDKRIESLINDILTGNIDKDISDHIYDSFKKEMTAWLTSSKLNYITGYETFNHIDIINGCTQFIDNLYMKPVQVIPGDYKYHERLGLASFCEIGNLIPEVPLIIAAPFPKYGDICEKMNLLLEECTEKNIPIHIDGAWISCSRDITFDLSHPAIQSVGISLSKGLGLGWNRIGLRYSRQRTQDSITIMNDFHMNNRALVIIGLHFIRNLSPDYLWKTYGEVNATICKDFNLTPTKAIHLALREGQPVGLSPLIRYVTNQ